MYVTLTLLKDWLLPESQRAGYQWDDVITAIGTGVAAAFDRYCNRTIAYTVGKIDTFRGNVDVFVASCYPLISLTSVHLRESIEDDWESQTVNDVVDQWDADSGVIKLAYPLSSSSADIKVTYTGGYWYYTSTYTTLPAGATALPEALLYAFRIQVMEHWKTLDKTGLTLAASKQPEASYLYPAEFKPLVRDILNSYVRHQIL